LKIFVGDSLAGNDTVNQAREFYEYTKYDGSILTKSDADSKGGAAISIAYLTHKPILYLGIGQGYGDLEVFDHDRFLDSIFKDKVYDKSAKILTPTGVISADNISKDEPVIEIPNVNSPSENSKLESPSSNPEKITEMEEIKTPSTVPQTLEVAPNKINDNPKLDDGLLNPVIEEKMDSRTVINEPKPKGGLFFKKIFKDNKDKKDTDDGKHSTADKIETRKEMKKKENKSKSKSKSEKENESENDEVVYLTDDDINDLIK
jgi:fused signal recognition particle receptor